MKKGEWSHLRNLARKATKGEWIAVGRQIENINDDLPDIAFVDLSGHAKQDAINAEYIAAAQPKNILILIEQLNIYRQLIKNLEEKLNEKNTTNRNRNANKTQTPSA